MGKPYASELRALPSTYSWALSQPIAELARAVERLQSHSLLAVGSGGSYTTCQYVAQLHAQYTNQIAMPLTPLQAVSSQNGAAMSGVIIPTAGGNNPDVIAAVRLLALQEPMSLLVICGSADSRVGEIAKRFPVVDFLPFEIPAGKDGFLATNSLLAFCVLLSRAYAEAAGQKLVLPQSFRSLIGKSVSTSRRDPLSIRLQDVLDRQDILLLHGPETVSAATDIESKFTEAALGNIKMCDYRQFAHGRHHWLAKRGAATSVLALVTQADSVIASQTLEILPTAVPSARLEILGERTVADLAGICIGFFIAGAAGELRGIDPGRPGVPSFGRKLYHANAFPKRFSADRSSPRIRAIERKSREGIDRLREQEFIGFWTDALDETLSQLTHARISSIVVDYDGTLCSEAQRFDPLPLAIVEKVTDLLKAGIPLGVATGRGKSVRDRLREAFSKTYWSQISVGYYNGSQILPLSSTMLPRAEEDVGSALESIVAAIRNDPLLLRGTLTLRPSQLTLERCHGLSLQALWEHVESLANRVSPGAVRVMRSGHSVDVVPDTVSKLAVVRHLQESMGSNSADAVVRIGDRGAWPGNDAQLLSSPLGLSVFEVSSDPHTCWNLAPPGYRGWHATLWYLNQLKPSRGTLRFRLPTGLGA